MAIINKMEKEKIVFRELEADEIEVKKGRGNMILLYKTARVDANILDETFGTLGWQKLYEVIDSKVYCKIGVKIDDEWIWKMDCGEETAIEAAKGEASDAMKRAGFAFGIGRKLYTSPKIKDPFPQDKNAVYEVRAIEYDDKKITSLYIAIKDTLTPVFYFGKFEDTIEVAKDFLNGNAGAVEYYAKIYGRQPDEFTATEWTQIWYELRKNGKI